jgi:hypothetical protein
LSTYLQLLGAAVFALGLVMLTGPWWTCLVVGAGLVALGYLAERADGPRSARSDRRDGSNTEGAA